MIFNHGHARSRELRYGQHGKSGPNKVCDDGVAKRMGSHRIR